MGIEYVSPGLLRNTEGTYEFREWRGDEWAGWAPVWTEELSNWSRNFDARYSDVVKISGPNPWVTAHGNLGLAPDTMPAWLAMLSSRLLRFHGYTVRVGWEKGAQLQKRLEIRNGLRIRNHALFGHQIVTGGSAGTCGRIVQALVQHPEMREPLDSLLGFCQHRSTHGEWICRTPYKAYWNQIVTMFGGPARRKLWHG